MKNMLTLKVFENSQRVSFSKVLCGVLCIVYTCVDDAYPDFIQLQYSPQQAYRFAGTIISKKKKKGSRVKANSKPQFDNKIVSAIQRQDHSCRINSIKISNIPLLKLIRIILKLLKNALAKNVSEQKKSCFQEEL